MNKVGNNVKCANMTSNKKLEISAIVKFCKHTGDISSSKFEEIKLTKGENSVSRLLVFSLHESLKNVEDEITDSERR